MIATANKRRIRKRTANARFHLTIKSLRRQIPLAMIRKPNRHQREIYNGSIIFTERHLPFHRIPILLRLRRHTRLIMGVVQIITTAIPRPVVLLENIIREVIRIPGAVEHRRSGVEFDDRGRVKIGDG